MRASLRRQSSVVYRERAEIAKREDARRQRSSATHRRRPRCQRCTFSNCK
jgi:hypothetical protein